MKILDREDCLEKMYKIIGAAMDLYNELGYGYSEPIYQECLSIICTEKNIPWEREKPLKMFFHGHELKKAYIADFVCYDDIIVELKAVSELTNEHRGQLFNYLRITLLVAAEVAFVVFDIAFSGLIAFYEQRLRRKR